MAAPRLDCYLEQLAAQPDGLAQLKAGDALHVVQHDAGLGCSTADGALVGLLPPGVVPQLRGGSWTATVRSLRWQEGALAQLQIRLTPGELPAPPPGPPAANEEEEEENIARLTKEQLEHLAQDKEVRWMLRDERLQKVIRDIDAAPDRELALVRALQGPNFKEFTDKVLLRVAPEAP